MAAKLTEAVVTEISTLTRDKGQERLLECLGWQILDYEDDLQWSIQFDFLYSNLEFCIQKGFPPSEICHLFELSCDLLDCARRGKQVISVLSIYKAKCTELVAHGVGQQTMNSFSENFFRTFMKHYKLYEYVTEEPRGQNCAQLVLRVNTPPATLPLSQGKEAAVWNYMEQLSHIEAKEKQQLLKRMEEREETRLVDHRAIEDAYEQLSQCPADTDTQAVMEIINNAAGAHIRELAHGLQFKVQNAVEDLTFKLEKNSIPRPPQMGSPIHYATAGAKAKINSSRSEKREARKPANKN